MAVLRPLGHTLEVARGMAWQIAWSFILGLALSAIAQALVRKATTTGLLGDRRPKTLAVASGLGIPSSSCSYAAVAPLSAVQKGRRLRRRHDLRARGPSTVGTSRCSHGWADGGADASHGDWASLDIRGHGHVLNSPAPRLVHMRGSSTSTTFVRWRSAGSPTGSAQPPSKRRSAHLEHGAEGA